MERKKLTRKEILDKYENLKIDSQRRLADLRNENNDLKAGSAQLSRIVDTLLGYIAQEYGDRSEDGRSWVLKIPKTERMVRIESRVWTDKDEQVLGTIVTATEVDEDELEVWKQENNG